MKAVLWILQIILGVYFFAIGILHFIVPPGLPGPMAWMYDLSPTIHIISGAAEILGGLGLVLPGLTRIQTRLVPLAAIGLALVMTGALVYHGIRGEYQTIVLNVLLLVLNVFVAIGRWRNPIPNRNS